MTDRSLTIEGDVNLTAGRRVWIESLTADTRSILNADAASFLHQSLSTPCIEALAGCDGIYLETVGGKRIMDFHGNNLHQVGYKNPKVIDAVTAQLQTLPFSPRRYTNKVAVDLAKQLTSVCQGLNRVLFAPGGSEANSMALKLARIATGKHKVVSMWGAFHGSGLDTISVGGEASFRKNIGPLLPGVEHVPPPDTYRGLWSEDALQDRYVDYIRYVFEHEGDVGALIAETIRNTDVQVPAQGFWKKVRALCDEFGVLLILDEIPIALYRTGRFFAFENFGIVPDMVTIGKGLGGGVFPMAALLTGDSMNVAVEHSIGHFTHEKSPVGCAAGLAVLEVFRENDIPAHVHKLEKIACDRLADMKNRYELIGDVRGLGLLWGIDLVTDRNTKERACAKAEKIMYRCLDKGLSFKVAQGNVIVLAPPLIITENELEQAFDILENAFRNLNS